MPFFLSLNAIIPESIKSNDIHHPAKIVAGRHQGPFTCHLLETAHHKMRPFGPVFQGTERMLNQP
ncbi:MAG: hypothetical protein GY927_03435 [bacterium]|nr:hypothetical protein [bacterium]